MTVAVDRDVHLRGACWRRLALFALGLSAIYALGLVMLRLPLTHEVWAADELFRRLLVSHVELAVVAWLLASAAARWAAVSGGHPVLFWGGASGLSLVALAPFLTDAPVLLVNYLPAIDHPIFWTGGALFVSAVLGVALHFLRAGLNRCIDCDPSGWLRIAAAALVVACAMVLVSAGRGGWGGAAWSGGHWLLFVFVALAVDAWHALLGRPLLPLVRGGAIVQGVIVIVGLCWAVGHPNAQPVHDTRLMQWLLWPIPLAVAFGLVAHVWRAPRSARGWAALASIALFVVGCLLGAAIRSDSLMIPAHYHVALGALTAALLAVHCLPEERPDPAFLRALFAYLVGKVLLAAGLILLGMAGGARKTPGSGLATGDPLVVGGGAALLIGGVLAAVGILWIMGIRIVRRRAWMPMEQVGKVQVRHG